jgi:hypothetical protein
MIKSVLKKEDLSEIIQKVHSIQPHHAAKWGEMNVVEMLMHCAQVAEAVINSSKSAQKANWKQVISKYIFLYVKKEFPKLVKGPKRFEAKGKVSEEDFMIWKDKLFEVLEKFQNLEKPLAGFHPFFGPLNHQQWGIMVYKHTHHHLKQFGG